MSANRMVAGYEIKPCPFCGGEPTFSGSIRMFILCLACDAASRICEDESEAVEAWNRRAGEGK